MTVIEDFSGGYYRLQMDVQPLERGPCIERGLYDLIGRNIYAQTNAPVTMRLGLDVGSTFRPTGENGMPTDVIGLPTGFLDSVGVHPSAEEVSIFILKPKNAYLFNLDGDF